MKREETTIANSDILDRARGIFREWFGPNAAVEAYAPGRVEILGNHTDYNEGYVLSAAINFGTFFLALPSQDSSCRLVAGDLLQEVSFDAIAPAPSKNSVWANYVIGVLAGVRRHGHIDHGFNGVFFGNVPLGAGLSSSAALEIAAGLALSSLYGLDIPKIDLARIGQAAEHDFVGVKCGLLDQISSLFGQEQALVMSDFRTLAVETVAMGDDACFLMCNTNSKHQLVDGAYNERRSKCEEATAFFADVLTKPVEALRDVDERDLAAHRDRMPELTAKRAAHPIGENARVLRGRELLHKGDLEEFGRLMFESHESSRVNFENSCPELDFLVEQGAQIPGVLGARLSGGGFGGSAVMLVHPRDTAFVSKALASAYDKKFGHPCDVRVILPSNGARVVTGQDGHIG